MNKKRNMTFWDEIDDISEEFVKQFIGCAVEELELDDDTITDIAKTVQSTILDELRRHDIDVNTLFPYVDENY